MFSWFRKKAAPAAPQVSAESSPPSPEALSQEPAASAKPQGQGELARGAVAEPLPERVDTRSQAAAVQGGDAVEEPAIEAQATPEEPAEPGFDELKRLMDQAPQDAHLALRAARAGLAEGRKQQAIPIFHRAARILLEREPDAGIEAYAELRKVSELGAETHFLLADIHREAGRLKEAESEVRAVLRSDLNHVEALLRLCDLCIAGERFRDAELSVNRVLTVDPRDPFAREKLGDVYVASDRPEEAVKAYVMAAHNFLSLQEKAEALRLYERVLELDPQHPTAIREIPSLKAALGSTS